MKRHPSCKKNAFRDFFVPFPSPLPKTRRLLPVVPALSARWRHSSRRPQRPAVQSGSGGTSSGQHYQGRPPGRRPVRTSKPGRREDERRRTKQKKSTVRSPCSLPLSIIAGDPREWRGTLGGGLATSPSVSPPGASDVTERVVAADVVAAAYRRSVVAQRRRKDESRHH